MKPCADCDGTGVVLWDQHLPMPPDLPGTHARPEYRTVEVAYRCSCPAGARFPTLALSPRGERRG